MKISIKRDKIINHMCPVITKDMMDVFYDKLSDLLIRYKNINDNFTKLDNINVRINQAYNGCFKYHFYIKINNIKHEHHMILSEGDRLPIHMKSGMRSLLFKRLDNSEIIVPQKPLDKIKKDRVILEEKRKTLSRVKKLTSKYKLYLKLKEEFGS